MPLRTVAIFVAAAVAELGGTYAIWRWRREGAPLVAVAVGLLLLLAYALVQTLQPEVRYGRVYAAYAGVFLVGAMCWAWVVDGERPDLFDGLGALVVLAGVAIVLWGRKLFP
ncbi:MAG: YnfA family protein [Actinomycetota bacterium]